MADESTPVTPLDYAKEGIKLIKNSKGYNWEIKVLSETFLTSNDVDRLVIIDRKLRENFGTQ